MFDDFSTGAGPLAADVHAGRPLQEGGWVARAFLSDPGAFGSALEPVLSAARAHVLERDPDALLRTDDEVAEAEEIRGAKATLGRRISIDRAGASPLLLWNRSRLIVGMPTMVPTAGQRASARVWLGATGESAWCRATRMDPDASTTSQWARAWHANAVTKCINAQLWQCDLPAFTESVFPLAVEIAPNPDCFLGAMLIAHHGAAAIVAGEPVGVGMTMPHARNAAPASLFASGWSYLRPDRSSGSSIPMFPYGAPAPRRAVFVADEAIYRACVEHTWVVSLADAVKLALTRGRGGRAAT
jgi:hypothetical protein